jgi:hypothetical protein
MKQNGETRDKESVLNRFNTTHVHVAEHCSCSGALPVLKMVTVKTGNDGATPDSDGG